MRAGTFDRWIVLRRYAEAVSDAGTVTLSWQTIGQLAAELVSLGGVAAGAAFGELQTDTMVFRTRYLSGLTTKDQIVYGGDFYSIKSIAEIGRRRGLELRCERIK